MAKLKIMVTCTSTMIYTPDEGDLSAYEEEECFNIDQCAAYDLKELEDGIALADISDAEVEESNFKVQLVLVDDDGTVLQIVRQPDEKNTERDYDLFPETDDEAEDEEND